LDFASQGIVSERRKKMKKILPVASVVVAIVAALAWTTSPAEQRKEIVSVTADEVKWFTPTFYTDGRQRAHLFGDSNQDGDWVDRVKIPSGVRVLAHTHSQDELVTVIEGTWYLGQGTKFDSARLKSYPAHSFIVIPAGLPHFVATKEGAVVIQLSGVRKFETSYVEK
jgi:quercetin dioxygenase-like cupin family protein